MNKKSISSAREAHVKTLLIFSVAFENSRSEGVKWSCVWILVLFVRLATCLGGSQLYEKKKELHITDNTRIIPLMDELMDPDKCFFSFSGFLNGTSLILFRGYFSVKYNICFTAPCFQISAVLH
ncbi:hypothetical protein E2C01_042201 [Portunus trituberculatus]|uniref:Uncharacterized protein n=1 Tax=Portunus trituberculatus TaxID=210409 RepID=A0A5B7FU47_PORTR|nr:hypothetical protein [Portunus trituberculatus]